MKLSVILAKRGPTYFFRGLREGNPVLFLFGIFLTVVRISGKRRSKKPIKIKIKPGQSVILRVTRPGSEEATYRIDP
jgi:hypothetical protein